MGKCDSEYSKNNNFVMKLRQFHHFIIAIITICVSPSVNFDNDDECIIKRLIKKASLVFFNDCIVCVELVAWMWTHANQSSPLQWEQRKNLSDIPTEAPVKHNMRL